MDAFTTFYGGDRAERVMFMARVFGAYTPVYWGALLFNCLLPQLFWLRRLRVNQPAIVLICLAWSSACGSSATRSSSPACIGRICPRPGESSMAPSGIGPRFFGTIGMFLSGILLSVRYVPIVSMHEMRALIAKRAHSPGGAHEGLLAGFDTEQALSRAVERLG